MSTNLEKKCCPECAGIIGTDNPICGSPSCPCHLDAQRADDEGRKLVVLSHKYVKEPSSTPMEGEWEKEFEKMFDSFDRSHIDLGRIKNFVRAKLVSAREEGRKEEQKKLVEVENVNVSVDAFKEGFALGKAEGAKDVLTKVLAKSHTTDDAREIRYFIKEEFLARNK